jgi:hypothetical protein
MHGVGRGIGGGDDGRGGGRVSPPYPDFYDGQDLEGVSVLAGASGFDIAMPNTDINYGSCSSRRRIWLLVASSLMNPVLIYWFLRTPVVLEGMGTILGIVQFGSPSAWAGHIAVAKLSVALLVVGTFGPTRRSLVILGFVSVLAMCIAWNMFLAASDPRARLQIVWMSMFLWSAVAVKLGCLSLELRSLQREPGAFWHSMRPAEYWILAIALFLTAGLWLSWPSYGKDLVKH